VISTDVIEKKKEEANVIDDTTTLADAKTKQKVAKVE